MKLGVNIDHVATLREVRKALEPDPLFAALICEASGADSIVAHLREDRRHIKDQDIFLLRKAVRSKFNLEMSLADDIVGIACKVKPDRATLVPERRQELTTEGGLDVLSHSKRVKQVLQRLQDNGIIVSLFIDPKKKQIDAARKTGAREIELHTGRYAGSRSGQEEKKYLKELREAAKHAIALGFTVNAGHGLDYYNAGAVAGITGMEELNIGYSIVCRAVLVGLGHAVKEMKTLINQR